MAKQYLSKPASSTPCERCFSEGHLVCHHTYGHLSIDKNTPIYPILSLDSYLSKEMANERLSNTVAIVAYGFYSNSYKQFDITVQLCLP
jgi:hypothetical protein